MLIYFSISVLIKNIFWNLTNRIITFKEHLFTKTYRIWLLFLLCLRSIEIIYKSLTNNFNKQENMNKLRSIGTGFWGGFQKLRVVFLRSSSKKTQSILQISTKFCLEIIYDLRGLQNLYSLWDFDKNSENNSKQKLI